MSYEYRTIKTRATQPDEELNGWSILGWEVVWLLTTDHNYMYWLMKRQRDEEPSRTS